VIPGTHKLDLQVLQRRTDVANVLSSQIDPAWVDESQAVDLVLKAGDVSVHHPNVIHGSNANTSTKRRCGLTIRYIPTSTRIRTKENERWASAFLLRGEAVLGVNDYHPFPRYIEGEHMPFRGSEAWAGASGRAR
jgi:ectoine hydroxylase-related dioxygenase (phytanoyl-CoA dioxygenase family)